MWDNAQHSPMANNNLPSSISELLDLATHNIAGIQSKGSAIGLLQYTAANFSPVVTALTLKQSAFNGARSAYFLAYAPVLAWMPEARAFGMLARKLLGVSLGEDWSPAWVAWGWVDQTTEVPKDLVGIKALLGAIKGRLLADPSYEVSSPKIAFSASPRSSRASPSATSAPVSAISAGLSVPKSASTRSAVKSIFGELTS